MAVVVEQRLPGAGAGEAGATSGRPLHQTRQVCGTVADTEGGGGGSSPGGWLPWQWQ